MSSTLLFNRQPGQEPGAEASDVDQVLRQAAHLCVQQAEELPQHQSAGPAHNPQAGFEINFRIIPVFLYVTR